MSSQPVSPWRERLASPLTWHYAGFAVLLVLTIGLSVRLGLDWAATNGRSKDALAGKQVELHAMDLQTAPLRGLDQRVTASRAEIDAFYRKRIARNYSSFAGRVGDLQVKSGVRLSRMQYTQGPAGADLTEVSLDVSISGAYPDIMRFVNSLERDPMFFVIRGLQLTGQQGGLVNLRLRVSTWMRPADVPGELPPTPKLGQDVSNPDVPGAEPTPLGAAGKEGE